MNSIVVQGIIIMDNRKSVFITPVQERAQAIFFLIVTGGR